ncbi:hypothetical protein NW768_012189 [Fusarium equiseti]|uniref:Uncharacterized protein n=1 Tax=Fusarium equiseti TaxID=61235 RepID=A0ABQ8QW17_FUSEQ|nr:hypothetical protein NW768_012189 [Fusarium equiseti]
MPCLYQTPQCPSLEGHIVILPKLSEIDASCTITLPSESGIFNHPVVILSKQDHDEKVAALVTTHPDTSWLLIVAYGNITKKQSHVNFKEIHEIPLTALRPCWRDNDLHLEKGSYEMLIAEMRKQNVGNLSVRLHEYRIPEQVAQSTYGQRPVSASNRCTCQGCARPLAHGTSSTRIYDSSTLGSYGTFERTSASPMRTYASTSYPNATVAAFAINSACNLNDTFGTPHVWQPRPARPSHIMPQRNQLPLVQWTQNEGSSDESGCSCLGFVVITCLRFSPVDAEIPEFDVVFDFINLAIQNIALRVFQRNKNGATKIV